MIGSDKDRDKKKATNQKPRVSQAEKKRPETIPAIYISDDPVGLEAWRSGKNSPNPRPARPIK